MNRSLLVFSRFLKLSRSKNFCSLAVRVTENDPRNHRLEHAGKFYKISDNDFSSCFEPQIRNDFSRLLKVFRDKSIIVRREAVEVVDYMRNIDYSQPISRFVLYGRQGTGKTVVMAHISHCAMTHGDWLLVYFGDLYRILHFSPELTANSIHEELYDVPTIASGWLQSFMSINAKFLLKYNPKLLKRIDWNQKEYLLEGTPWTEMINFAIGRQKYASDCIGILLREAREHAVLNQFKVLGIIRGINCLWNMSKRCDINTNHISPNNISLLNYLRRFVCNDWHNGAIVCSVNRDTFYNPSASITHYPKSLLGDEGFKALDPFVPVKIDNFTRQEVTNYLNFLGDNRWLTVDSAKDPQGIGRREIEFLADNRPGELFDVTLAW